MHATLLPLVLMSKSLNCESPNSQQEGFSLVVGENLVELYICNCMYGESVPFPVCWLTGLLQDSELMTCLTLLCYCWHRADKRTSLSFWHVHCRQSLDFLQFVGSTLAGCRWFSESALLVDCVLFLHSLCVGVLAYVAWMSLNRILLHPSLLFCLKWCSQPINFGPVSFSVSMHMHEACNSHGG